jgi:hypothetical protein
MEAVVRSFLAKSKEFGGTLVTASYLRLTRTSSAPPNPQALCMALIRGRE